MEDRFWSHVAKNGECLLWQACTDVQGYGRFKVRGVTFWAHRFAYCLAFGSVPAGHDVHHTCRHRACVEVAHLEAKPKTHHGQEHGRQHGRQSPGVEGGDPSSPY